MAEDDTPLEVFEIPQSAYEDAGAYVWVADKTPSKFSVEFGVKQ